MKHTTNSTHEDIAPPTITTPPIRFRLLLFFSTFVGLVVLLLLYFGIINGASIGDIIKAFFSLVAAPIFALIFPIGLGMFIIPESDSDVAVIVGYILYAAIFLLGIFVKGRKAFIFIYLIFIMLLIMNVIGFSKIEIRY